MIDLLKEEDKSQRRISWANQDREDAGPETELRGDGEDGGGREPTTQDSLEEEDVWEDMIPSEEAGLSRSESVEEASPCTSVRRRPRTVQSPGRPGGGGGGGFGWLKGRSS